MIFKVGDRVKANVDNPFFTGWVDILDRRGEVSAIKPHPWPVWVRWDEGKPGVHWHEELLLDDEFEVDGPADLAEIWADCFEVGE